MNGPIHTNITILKAHMVWFDFLDNAISQTDYRGISDIFIPLHVKLVGRGVVRQARCFPV